MEDGLPTPEESLDSLKRRVDDAELRLDFASQHLKQVHDDHLSGDIPLAEPYAREFAIRAERSARDEYLRVLKIYEDFLAHARAAHDDSAPQVRGTSAGAGTQRHSRRDDEEL